MSFLSNKNDFSLEIRAVNQTKKLLFFKSQQIKNKSNVIVIYLVYLWGGGVGVS